MRPVPGGRDRIVSGRLDVWDLRTGDRLARAVIEAGSLTCLAFSPHEGVLATSGDDGLVRLWRIS